MIYIFSRFNRQSQMINFFYKAFTPSTPKDFKELQGLQGLHQGITRITKDSILHLLQFVKKRLKLQDKVTRPLRLQALIHTPFERS